MAFLSDLNLVVDAGLFILIWMVQILVYPNFLYHTKPGLQQWHTTYTPRITGIVAPLMLVQLGFAIYGLYTGSSAYSTVYALLVFFTWVITFTVFIPLHNKVQSEEYSEKNLQKLVRYNWVRTVIWTVIIVFSFLKR